MRMMMVGGEGDGMDVMRRWQSRKQDVEFLNEAQIQPSRF